MSPKRQRGHWPWHGPNRRLPRWRVGLIRRLTAASWSSARSLENRGTRRRPFPTYGLPSRPALAAIADRPTPKRPDVERPPAGTARRQTDEDHDHAARRAGDEPGCAP